MTQETPASESAQGSPGADDQLQQSPPDDGDNSFEGAEPATPPPEAPPAPPDVSQASSTGGRKPADERIRELINEKKVLTEYGEFWRGRALQGAPPAEKPVAIEDRETAPTLDEFDHDTAKWADAHAKWTDKQVDRRVRAGLDREKQQAEAARVESEWKSRATAFAAKTPDFQEVVTNPTLPVSDTVAALIRESDLGPQVLYHLGMNPVEATRIYHMSKEKQAAAFGRLEALMSQTPPPPPPGGKPPAQAPANALARSQSNAPPPPSTGSGSAPATKSLESMTLDEYMKHRLTWARGKK